MVHSESTFKAGDRTDYRAVELTSLGDDQG
jgi:hypothetical protein